MSWNLPSHNEHLIRWITQDIPVAMELAITPVAMPATLTPR